MKEIVGFIAYLGGFFTSFIISTFFLSIVVPLFMTIPFLFFKITRTWKTFVTLLFIFSGYSFGKIVGGIVLMNYITNGTSVTTARFFGLPTMGVFIILFSIMPLLLFKIIKTRKMKWSVLGIFFLLLCITAGLCDFELGGGHARDVKAQDYMKQSVLKKVNVQAQDYGLEASIERDNMSIGEPVYLNITFRGDQNVGRVNLPDQKGVKFKYVGPSTEISIVNGIAISQITHNYLVVPSKKGEYKLGPFDVIYDGNTYRSNSVELTVHE